MFFGNSFPDFDVKIPDKQCYIICSGDLKEFCGRYFTMNIYWTGINRFAPKTAESVAKAHQPKVKNVLILNVRVVRHVLSLICWA